MGIRVDWKRSLVMTAILLVILYVLRSMLDPETYCMAAIILVIVVFAVGNLVGRGR